MPRHDAHLNAGVPSIHKRLHARFYNTDLVEEELHERHIGIVTDRNIKPVRIGSSAASSSGA